LNEVFAQCLEPVLSSCDVQVVYITGQRYFHELQQALLSLNSRFPRRLHLLPYHAALPALLAKATLVVSRAGATTCAEITALGVPAILIPSPNVINNHQEHNARVLADGGAALLIGEANLSVSALSAKLIALLRDPAELRQMSAASKALGYPDAAARMAAVLREELQK